MMKNNNTILMNTNSGSAARLNKKIDDFSRKIVNKKAIKPQSSKKLWGLRKIAATASNKTMSSSDAFHSIHSDYYNTLKDPFSYSGAKIPDDTTYSTCTFSCIYRETLVAFQTPGGNWVAGFQLNGFDGSGLLQRLTSYADTTTGNLTWGSAGSGTSAWGGSFEEWGLVLDLYSRFRPVSAGLVIKPAMSSLSDSGDIYALQIPTYPISTTKYQPNTDPLFLTFSETIAAFTAERAPIKTGGACGCYHPADESAFQYTTTQGSPGTFINYGAVRILAAGLAASASLEVTVQVNYEAIPKLSTMSILTPSPSIRDSHDLDLTMNKIAQESAVEVGPSVLRKATKVSKAGLVTHVPKKPAKPFINKMFDFISGTVKKIAPAVLEAIV
jgi:hypothetical protein